MAEQTHARRETCLPDPVPSPALATDDSGMRFDPDSTYRTPRWVRIFGIILIVVLLLLFLTQHLVFEGMGGHML